MMVVANNTDVVTSFYAFFDLGIVELWIEYGSGKHQHQLQIHAYANVLGEEVCQTLPFWYAVISCETISSFAGRGRQCGKLGTVFQSLHRTFLGTVCLKHLFDNYKALKRV